MLSSQLLKKSNSLGTYTSRNGMIQGNKKLVQYLFGDGTEIVEEYSLSSDTLLSKQYHEDFI